MRILKAAALVALFSIVGSGCSTAGKAPPTDVAAPAGVAAASAAASAAACPVTIPTGTFVPPLPWPPVPPDLYHAAWFGTNELWTMLATTGEVWQDLPQSGTTLGQKTWWFSTNYRDAASESRPDITVTGRRLDGAGETFTAGHPGTNGEADFGLAMLVGVDVPGRGCWELQGSYRGATLSYVVWIP